MSECGWEASEDGGGPTDILPSALYLWDQLGTITTTTADNEADICTNITNPFWKKYPCIYLYQLMYSCAYKSLKKTKKKNM